MKSTLDLEKAQFVKQIWTWTAIYPLTVVWFFGFLVGRMLGRGLGLPEQLLPLLFQSAIAALPFALLALCVQFSTGEPETLRGFKFSLVAMMAASVAIWGSYYADGISAYTGDGTGGANIGLGLLLLFSPLLLSLLIPVGYWVSQQLAARE